jgi:hypothetical protein
MIVEATLGAAAVMLSLVADSVESPAAVPVPLIAMRTLPTPFLLGGRPAAVEWGRDRRRRR